MVRPVTCPICGRESPPEAAGGAESKWFPFCSERCRNVDLYRWSEGGYAIVDPLTPERLHEELERGEDESV